MQAGRSSALADGAAAMRAAGTYDPDPRRTNPDHLALALTRPLFRTLVRSAPLRALAVGYYERLVPGVYAAHQARTRVLDGWVLDALAGGARQVVVLGAGFDSRAWRFRDRLGGVAWVEVDHPATQAVKRARLARVGLPVDHVRFVAEDFEDAAWTTRLAGTLAAVPTVFLWEGVTQYLTAQAVDGVLGLVASCAPGSRVLFDYVTAAFVAEPDGWPLDARHARFSARSGEPYRFGLDVDALPAWAAARGLEVVEHLDGPALEARFGVGETGRYPVPTVFGLVALRVPAPR